jgi:hypothetical protein
LLLADAAQAVDNKLFILGGGWSVTGPGPTTMAIALKVEVPWDKTNRQHRWRIELLDADGRQVLLAGPDNAQPLVLAGEFEVGRPAGTPEGTPIDLAMALNLGAVPFPADQRLVWKLWINDQTTEDWELRFTTRPVTPA